MSVFRNPDETQSDGLNKKYLGAMTLDPAFIPDHLPHRDVDLQFIARNFQPLFRLKKLNSISTIITVLGGPGYGKTAMVRFAVQRLLQLAEKKGLSIIGDYQNCWLTRSASSILGKVIQNQINIEQKVRGISAEELGGILKNYLIEEDLHLILTLDDVNALTSDDLNSFFVLQEEFGSQSRISLILISRPTEWHLLATTLNTRIDEILTVYPYTLFETIDIVRYRGNLAFRPGTVEEGVYDMIAEIAHQHHNMRYAIELMARAGEKADEEQSKSITPEHIRSVKAIVYPELRTEILESMQMHELLALLAVARRLKNKSFIHTTIGDSFRYYKAAAEEWGEEPKRESSFRGYLRSLQNLGIINIVITASGRKKRGVRGRISLNDVPASVIIEKVENQLVKIQSL